MRRAIRKSGLRRDESGLTLIECVVALGLIAILLLPLAAVFYSGASSDADSRENGDAVAIAEAQLSKAQAITYGDLGYYEDQFPPGTCTQPGPPIVPADPGVPAYGPTGQQGVDLGCQPPAGTSPELQFQTSPIQVGSVKFTMQTYVVWASGSGGVSEAYKQVYSVVNWNENGNNATVTENALVYPGGLGAYTGPPTTTGGTPPLPPSVTGLTATVPDDADGGENQVDLTWAPASSPAAQAWVLSGGQFELVYATNSSELAPQGSTGTDSSWNPAGSIADVPFSGSSTTYSETSLSPSTTYYFEIIAFAADRSSWAVSAPPVVGAFVSATTLTPPPPCSVTSLTVSQPGTPAGDVYVKKSNDHLVSSAPLTIAVGYSGACTASDTVIVTATDASHSPDPLSPYTLTYSSSPTDYTYNPPSGLCPNASFSVTGNGNHTYTVSLDGIPQSLTRTVTFSEQNGGGSTC